MSSPAATGMRRDQASRGSALASRTLAEQILWLRQGVETTPMHVIKLSYLCHGWMLGLFEKPLLVEPAEAWRYGPILPTVYHAYKGFGGDAIDAVPTDRGDAFDAQQSDLVEIVLDAYKSYTALDLSAITHQTGTPWHEVYRDGRGEWAIIPNRLLGKHYKKRSRKAEAIRASGAFAPSLHQSIMVGIHERSAGVAL